MPDDDSSKNKKLPTTGTVIRETYMSEKKDENKKKDNKTSDN